VLPDHGSSADAGTRSTDTDHGRWGGVQFGLFLHTSAIQYRSVASFTAHPIRIPTYLTIATHRGPSQPRPPIGAVPTCPLLVSQAVDRLTANQQCRPSQPIQASAALSSPGLSFTAHPVPTVPAHYIALYNSPSQPIRRAPKSSYELPYSRSRCVLCRSVRYYPIQPVALHCSAELGTSCQPLLAIAFQSSTNHYGRAMPAQCSELRTKPLLYSHCLLA